ncbi:acidic mammalian chitinase isoform X2 [Leptinotarsa decemlineata]|uniref:acidic mammalian chitinase isoform X2 n=1 Tax=Leptinotarsa decemlineata TaxID=7539 RepID=UPI003D307C4A
MFLFVLLWVYFAGFGSAHFIQDVSARNVVCYYMNSNYATLAPPEKIDPKLCTHLNYAFVRIEETGNLTYQSKYVDITQGVYKRVIALKKINPSLKVLLSIGDTNASIFSKVAANETSRKNLVESSKHFLKTYSFDGLDVDWELPNATDRDNFIQILKDLRQEFDKENWILTAAVYPNPSIGYNVPEMVKYLHMFNLMCYNYYGPWSAYTGQNSPLFASSIESAYEKRNLNIAASVKNWIDAGAPKEAINVGVPFYGKAFQLADPKIHGLHAPFIKAGSPVSPTFRQLCSSKYSNWTRVWDDEQKNPYKYKGNQWIGYDDEKSIRKKAQYVVSQKLAGIMIWQIGQDDVSGDCGEKQILLKIINEELKQKP